MVRIVVYPNHADAHIAIASYTNMLHLILNLIISLAHRL